MKFTFKKILYRTASLLALTAFMISCGPDESTGPIQRFSFHIESLAVHPLQVQFNPSQGVTDTTITFDLTGTFSTVDQSRSDNAQFAYELIRTSDGASVAFGTIPITASQTTIQQSISISTNTTDFNDYRLYIFAIRNDLVVSNTAQSLIKVRGFAIGVPEILAVSNPDTVWIPSTGANPFALQAKATHPDGQPLIDRVLVHIRDQNNNLLSGSPFQLFDDGSQSSGDMIPGDSIYTRVFSIGPGNNPDVYELSYFAIDNLGASSDTIRTTMVIQR